MKSMITSLSRSTSSMFLPTNRYLSSFGNCGSLVKSVAGISETQGVVLRVNYPYAQTAEFSEMPATLLAKLPQLPKELRYRFVGRNMLLVDRESDVIIDYMPDALP